MKKTVILKKLTSFLLAALLAFSALNVTALAAGQTRFRGSLSSETAADLSGIKLDIYRSSLVSDNDDFQKYKNKYIASVYTDKNGGFSFERPAGMFVVTADMSTLPKKTGITENMWTVFDGSVSSLSAKVEKISGIYIDCENAESGEVAVTITDAGGAELYCDYTTDISDTEITETVIDDTGKRTFHTERVITVKANGVKQTQVLTSEYTEKTVPIVSLQKPEFDHPRSYSENGGFFEIHYDEYQYSLQTVMNVYGTLKDAKAFYDKHGFKAPIKEDGSEKYNIYLVTEGVASATTRHIKNGSGYIILQAPTNYSRETHLFITNAIAHEVFHAVMNAYTRKYGVTPSKWFRESLANWAGMEFLGYSTATPKFYIDVFQSNPELSITDTYDSRIYGSLTFALTLYEHFGGMDTIKKILKEFRYLDPTDPTPEFAAIDAALSKINKGWSFKKAFTRFALNNMYPASFYSLPESDKWNNAARSAGKITGSCTLRKLECQPLSVKYYDAAPDTSGKDIYITISDLSGDYSDTSLCCMINKKDGSRYFYGNVTSFCTFRIKHSEKLRSTAVSFGIVNASADIMQDMNVKITYA